MIYKKKKKKKGLKVMSDPIIKAIKSICNTKSLSYKRTN